METRKIRSICFNFLFLFCAAGIFPVFAAATEPEYLTDLSFIQKVINIVKQNYVEKPAEERILVYGAIRGIIKELGDPYSRFLDPEQLEAMQEETNGEFGGVGIVIAIKNGKMTVISPIEGTPAYYSGVKPGDLIVKINDIVVDNIDAEDAMELLRGEAGTDITLHLKSEGIDEIHAVTMKRDFIHVNSISDAGIIDLNTGYIRISNFSEGTAADLKKELQWMVEKGIGGIVLDLRSNPGGLLIAAVETAQLFLSRGRIVSLKSRTGKETVYSAYEKEFFDGPLIVLINRGTASASEILAGAIKDNRRGIVVGEKSFGKGVVQSIIPLDLGCALALTTSYYYTPSGKCIHNIGIEPDIEIPLPLASAISDNELTEERLRIKEREEQNIVIRNKGEHASIEISMYDTQLQRAYEILKALEIFNK